MQPINKSTFKQERAKFYRITCLDKNIERMSEEESVNGMSNPSNCLFDDLEKECKEKLGRELETKEHELLKWVVSSHFQHVYNKSS